MGGVLISKFGPAVGTTPIVPTAVEELELSEDFPMRSPAPTRVFRTALYDSFS
jgi:hypothetical protein